MKAAGLLKELQGFRCADFISLQLCRLCGEDDKVSRGDRRRNVYAIGLTSGA